MKKLLFSLILLAAFSCKKEATTPYKITGVYSTNGGFACKYEAKAAGHPNIIIYEECGKYKTGQIIFNVQ